MSVFNGLEHHFKIIIYILRTLFLTKFLPEDSIMTKFLAIVKSFLN